MDNRSDMTTSQGDTMSRDSKQSAVNTIGPYQLLTSEQAAKMLAISPRKLWGLDNEGSIRRVQIGRSVRYDPADLRRWLDEQKH